MYFHVGDFSLSTFKEEIISLFNNKDPLYNFHTDVKYYIHLFEGSNGKIIDKVPFILYSVVDHEDLIEDYYNELLPKMDTYYSSFKDIEYPPYIGLYISLKNEDILNPNYLLEQKEICLNNIQKMNSDLLFPISWTKI
jgi:hypothetical protein